MFLLIVKTSHVVHEKIIIAIIIIIFFNRS